MTEASNTERSILEQLIAINKHLEHIRITLGAIRGNTRK